MPPNLNALSMLKRIIGRTEMVDLPSIPWNQVPCRIDTGAYRSSMHCDDIHLNENPDGSQTLVVTFQGEDSHSEKHFSRFSETSVKSSNGIAETRYLVALPVRIFGTDFITEFTLTNRTEMKFPVLLGRTFLRHGFIVDVRKTNQSFKTTSA